MGSAAAGITHKRLRQTAKATEEARFARTYSDRSVRWEDHPPLTPGPMETASPTVAEEQPLTPQDKKAKEDATALSKKNKFYKALKILLPHIGLTVLLLLYMAGGAAILMWLEQGPELSRRIEKIENVTRLYNQIANASAELCGRSDVNAISTELRDLLIQLSRTHEYDDRFTDEDQLWTNDIDKLRLRWTYPAAFLYSLTVITTTGYDHVSPLTDAGRLFAVFFGLIGIPLMFITAADIGKFLSEIVTKFYIKFLICSRYLTKKFFPHLNSAKKQEPKSQSDPDDIFFGLEGDESGRVELPIVAYFCLILGYCAIGGLLFNSFENGPVWSFIHGFFFSFNTITTIGLGNIMVRNWLYLCLIVVYCIVGLAVITMCVDLASAQLKMLFTKLHYFGRKIRGARNTFFMAMSDDIKEAIRLIAALKKTRFSKGNITLEDIKKFLEIELQYNSQPFVPSNIHFIQWVDDGDEEAKEGGHSSDRSYVLTANLVTPHAVTLTETRNVFNNNMSETVNVHI